MVNHVFYDRAAGTFAERHATRKTFFTDWAGVIARPAIRQNVANR